MGYIDIKNKNGTGGNTAPSGYSSWLAFWEKKKGMTANSCKVYGCSGNSDVGGHVIKSGQGAKEYILPLCYKCNNKPDHEIFKALENDLISVT